jgi:nucleotide-binding universal stress UspA family protein
VALARRLVDRHGQLTLAHVHRGEMPSIELLQPEPAAADVNIELKSVVAAHAGAGLLVVGSRGYGPVKRLMLGSTSNCLARHARSSLLVLARIAASQTDGAEEQPGVEVGAEA